MREFAGDFYYDSERVVGGQSMEAHLRPLWKYRPSDTRDVGALAHGTISLDTQSPSGTLYQGQIHHKPWPLQPAKAELPFNDLAAPHGFALEGPPPLLHFARSLDVVIWGLEPA